MTPQKRLLWLYIFITDIIFPVVSCGPFQLAYSLLYPSCMILTRYAKRNFSAFATIFKRHRQQFLQERAYLNSIFSSSSIIFAKKNCAQLCYSKCFAPNKKTFAGLVKMFFEESVIKSRLAGYLSDTTITFYFKKLFSLLLLALQPRSHYNSLFEVLKGKEKHQLHHTLIFCLHFKYFSQQLLPV